MPWRQLYTIANWWVQPQGWYLTHNYKRSTVFVCYSDLITEMSMLPRWECGLYRLHPEQILVHPVTNISSLGKFDWGVWCVIIFCEYNFEFDWLLKVTAVRKFVPRPPMRWDRWISHVTHTIASETSHSMRSVSFSPLVYFTKPWNWCCVTWHGK